MLNESETEPLLSHQEELSDESNVTTTEYVPPPDFLGVNPTNHSETENTGARCYRTIKSKSFVASVSDQMKP